MYHCLYIMCSCVRLCWRHIDIKLVYESVDNKNHKLIGSKNKILAVR